MREFGRFLVWCKSCLGLALLVVPSAADGFADEPPAAPREFRAAWVATVENIDWPSKRGLSTAEQQAEIERILNVAADLNLNAIVLQVRTTADALYASELEPWSMYLSGKQGVAPMPYYDPLEYWVTAAHARGIELHAWFNPYRAQMKPSELAASHVSRTMPDSVKQYDRYMWMDPGSKQAEQHSLAVFNDVVRRYDIDGVHIDDYFYPYPVTKDGAKVPFPDDASWAEYQAGVHFSMKALLENRQGLADTLKAGVYRSPALSPAMPWLDDSPPAPPHVAAERSADGKRTLKLTAGDDEAVWLWSLWTRSDDEWIFSSHPGQSSTIDIDASCSAWVLSVVDRSGNESSPVRSND